MRAILWRDLRHYFSAKFIFLILGCLLFTFAERQSTAYSYEQFILSMVSEHYYLTFCMMPIFLIFLYKCLEDDFEYVLIRSRKYTHYFFTKSFAILLQTLGFVGVQILLILVVSVGLPFDNQFSMEDNELFNAYAKLFDTPVAAIITALVFMVIGLSVLGIFFQMIHHFFDKKVTSILIIVLYVLMVLGLKIPSFAEIPLIMMNDYVILHYSFSSPFEWIRNTTGIFLVLVIVVISIRYYWNKTPQFNIDIYPTGLTFYYARLILTRKNFMIMIAVVSFIALWKLFNSGMNSEMTQGDYFLLLLYGHGLDGFHMISFLEQLILNGVPLYLLAIFTETLCDSTRLDLMVRMQRKVQWVKAVLLNSAAFIIIYVLFMALVSFSISFIAGLQHNGFSLPVIEVVSANRIILQLLYLKLFDLMWQFLLFFLIYLRWKDVTVAFLIVLSTNALILFPIKWLAFFPTGISNASRLIILEDSSGIPILHAFLILGVGVLIIGGSILFGQYNRFFQT